VALDQLSDGLGGGHIPHFSWFGVSALAQTAANRNAAAELEGNGTARPQGHRETLQPAAPITGPPASS